MISSSFLAAFLLAAPAGAQEWTRFRGPNGSGISEAKTVPVSWTEKEINWRVRLPGTGHSQPVIWGEKIFLTGAEDEGRRRIVLCLRAADGGVEWSKPYPMATHPKHNFNTFASSTPVVDGEFLIAALADTRSFTLRAFDHGGAEKWSRDLGPFISQHGQGASPIIFDDMVVIANDQDGSSSLVAVDRGTGEVRWKTERATAVTAYGTPCILQSGDRRPELIFTSQAHGLTAIDPRTGKVNWEAKLFDKRTVSSPVIAGDLAIGTCGSGGGGNFLVAVRAGGSGDVSQTRLAYKLVNSIPYVPTPIVRGDRLYLWSDKGVASCMEASTGKVIWQERVGGSYFGSPVWVNGYLYCISVDGEAVVISASDAFRIISRNPLGEPSHSTPAVAGGRLYLRTLGHLVSIGGKPQRKDMP